MCFAFGCFLYPLVFNEWTGHSSFFALARNDLSCSKVMANRCLWRLRQPSSPCSKRVAVAKAKVKGPASGSDGGINAHGPGSRGRGEGQRKPLTAAVTTLRRLRLQPVPDWSQIRL